MAHLWVMVQSCATGCNFSPAMNEEYMKAKISQSCYVTIPEFGVEMILSNIFVVIENNNYNVYCTSHCNRKI